VTEEIEVHADFTGPTKGQKPQFLICGLPKFHGDFWHDKQV
jgi:hypothetical protein